MMFAVVVHVSPNGTSDIAMMFDDAMDDRDIGKTQTTEELIKGLFVQATVAFTPAPSTVENGWGRPIRRSKT